MCGGVCVAYSSLGLKGFSSRLGRRLSFIISELSSRHQRGTSQVASRASQPPLACGNRSNSVQNMAESIFNLTTTVASSILEPMLGGSTLDKAEAIVVQAKDRSMSLLSFLDDQLYALGGLVESRFISVLNFASAPVRRLALIGSSAADVSSDCEEPKTDTLLRLVNLLVYVVSYAFGLASVWLLQRSQIEDKYQLQTEEHNEYRQHFYIESKLPAEDQDDKKLELVDTPQDFVKEKVDDDGKERDFVKDKVIDDGDHLKEQQQHDEEPDELTKLFDASWSLGTL